MHRFTVQFQEPFLHAAEVRRPCGPRAADLTTTELLSSRSSPTRPSCQRTSVTAATVQELSPTRHPTAAIATKSAGKLSCAVRCNVK